MFGPCRDLALARHHYIRRRPDVPVPARYHRRLRVTKHGEHMCHNNPASSTGPAKAAEYEDGSWEGPLVHHVRGRPSLYDETMADLHVRVPRSTLKALDQHAASAGKTRSQYVRDILATA